MGCRNIQKCIFPVRLTPPNYTVKFGALESGSGVSPASILNTNWRIGLTLVARLDSVTSTKESSDFLRRLAAAGGMEFTEKRNRVLGLASSISETGWEIGEVGS